MSKLFKPLPSYISDTKEGSAVHNFPCIETVNIFLKLKFEGLIATAQPPDLLKDCRRPSSDVAIGSIFKLFEGVLKPGMELEISQSRPPILINGAKLGC